MEQHQSKLADLRLVAKYFPVSNYSYPRTHTPSNSREETRDRESLGSDASVPGMIDDQGSEVSIEDEYQYHTTGAELWDSFWKAKPKERLSRMRSYPALIKLPAGHHSGNQTQKQKQQLNFGWRCPRTPTSNTVHQGDGLCWPLPPADERPNSQVLATKTPNIPSPVVSKGVADPKGQAIPPRTSSLLSPGTPLAPNQISSKARSPVRGHTSNLSVASSFTSTISNRTSVCTISTAASPPPSLPVSPTVLSPYPPPPPEPTAQPQTLPRPKKSQSFRNLRKLAFSSKTLAPTATTITTTQIQQPHQPPTQTSPPCLPPSPPFCVPSRRAPAPPLPAPQVSVFEYDSDSDSDAGSSDEDDSPSSSRKLARRIVRGIAHRGRHHHHHRSHSHSHHHYPRPRSASDSGGAPTPMGGLVKEMTRARAETVGAAAEVRHADEGVGRPRRQAYDVFGRILGRRSR